MTQDQRISKFAKVTKKLTFGEKSNHWLVFEDDGNIVKQYYETNMLMVTDRFDNPQYEIIACTRN